MKLFYNISITRKLVIMQLFTTLVVIIVCSVVFLYTDYSSLKTNKEKSILSLTHVIGTNLVAPMLFGDKETAAEIMNDLRVKEDVLNASILDVKNKAFVNYSKEGEKVHSFNQTNIIQETIGYKDDNLFIAYPMMSEKERIGTLWLRADISDIKGQLYDRVKMTFLVILFGVLLSFLLVLQLQKYITKPINKLVEVMSEIMLKKNYSLRSKVQSEDEIGKMAKAFNELLAQVEQHAVKLSETNNLLELRVELRTQELLEKNEKLIVSKAKEEESNRAKEQFMASISHEIRTPLNAIIGFQELLKDTELTPEQKEFLRSIDFAGRNLLVLINDILDMSKIEAGKFVFIDTEFNFRDTLKSVIELIEYKAKEKRITVSYEVDERIPKQVFGDHSRLSQILINLVSNAVKFTDNGYVKVKAKLLNESIDDFRCEFSIEDTGIGIAKENLNIIFDRFTQVSADANRKYGGTGLGLTIVKEIVELQGGKIRVESQPGVGSTFFVEMTIKKVKNHEQSSINDVRTLTENVEVNERPLHGLLAEDIVINQQLVQKIMSKWGYDIDVVSNGREAVEKAQANSYDFILMDIQMPEMDGFKATSLIRGFEDPVKRNVPIIALTAQVSSVEDEKSRALGMNGYLVKPFDIQELKKRIKDAVFNPKVSNQMNIETLNPEKTQFETHFDLSGLIDRAEGDNLFLKDIYQEFIIEMPKKMEHFKQYVTERNVDAMDKLIHGLRSFLPTFGMHSSLNLFFEISESIKKNEAKEIVDLKMSKLDGIVNQVIIGLQEVIKTLDMPLEKNDIV